MTTITEFLLARIAEDEAVVREARGVDALHQESKTFYSHLGESRDDWGVYCFNVPPDRMGRECEAKRRIVDTHVETEKTRNWIDYEFGDSAYNDVMGPLDEVLRALAAPYSDHPDYREEWKP